MARRRKDGLFEDLIRMPWPVGIAVGVFGFVLCSATIFKPFAWFVLVIGLAAAALSALGSAHRAQLVEQQTGIESLRAMGWKKFELLVGESYRRLGYQIEETGQGGADGGIDLLLRKGGQTTLVQCKQWRNQKIGVAVVREMFGLMTHHRAEAVKIVCTGTFSSECEAFCRDKPIELVDGPALLCLVQAVQTNAAGTSRWSPPKHQAGAISAEPTPTVEDQTVTCPRCRSAMAKRANRSTGLPFWGCTQYPKCKGTRAA